MRHHDPQPAPFEEPRRQEPEIDLIIQEVPELITPPAEENPIPFPALPVIPLPDDDPPVTSH